MPFDLFNLAGEVASELGLGGGAPEQLPDWPGLLDRLIEHSDGETSTGRILRRVKQWLSLAARYGSFTRFDEIKRTESLAELLQLLR